MYRFIIAGIVRRAFAAFNRGDAERALARFADDVHFSFAGEHALSADLRGRDQARGWFARLFTLLPSLRFTVHDVVVRGWPWNTVVMTRFSDVALLDGAPFENQGTQFLRLRWGRVVEDHILVDTQKLANKLPSDRLR
jgi:ketosteroid isomerase-like protein